MSATTEHSTLERIAATAGVVGSIALAYVYVLMPMLVVPSPFVYGFVAAWVVLVVASLAWWRRHPWWAFAVPVVGLVVGLAAYRLGITFLGWAP